jgi:hypothetical protein
MTAHRAQRESKADASATRPARLARAVAMIAASLPLSAIGDTGDTGDELWRGFDPIVHLRTYYWNSTNLEGAAIEAWALGGWAGFTTRWYGDSLQLGVLGYTSQKLHAPADKDGSLLLRARQKAIDIVGQAFASLRLAGQTFTAYRQMIDQPWVDPQDNRMIPNLFEGYLLSGKLDGLGYIGGYVTKIKTRSSDTFRWMSGVAGSSSANEGMALFGARFPIAEHGFVRIAEQYLVDTYNTAYADGEYPFAISNAATLRLAIQLANQQSVGAAGVGAFNTSMVGLRAAYDATPLGFQVAWTQTARDHATLNPFGYNPSYLNMLQIAFNNAGEKAWLIGAYLDMGALGLPALKASVSYGNGHDAINPATGAPLGSRNETDIRLAYVFETILELRGLSFGVQGSWLNQSGALSQSHQLRVFANYEVPLPRL